jgi:hypothetical protein
MVRVIVFCVIVEESRTGASIMDPVKISAYRSTWHTQTAILFWDLAKPTAYTQYVNICVVGSDGYKIMHLILHKVRSLFCFCTPGGTKTFFQQKFVKNPSNKLTHKGTL